MMLLCSLPIIEDWMGVKLLPNSTSLDDGYKATAGICSQTAKHLTRWRCGYAGHPSHLKPHSQSLQSFQRTHLEIWKSWEPPLETWRANQVNTKTSLPSCEKAQLHHHAAKCCHGGGQNLSVKHHPNAPDCYIIYN